MRRLAKLLLVLAVVAGAVFLKAGRPVNVELEMQLPDPPPAQVALVFTNKSDHVEGELRLTNPPAHERRAVRLKSGDYIVGVRMTPERTFTRSLVVDDSGTYTLDLR